MKIRGQEIRQKDVDRFESKIFVVTEGTHIGCYETTCAKNKRGYSPIRIKGKIVLAHRLMYQIHHPDEDIDDKKICHRCDNPACINIAHLFSGTQQENMTDMVNKSRQTKGSGIVQSKLTEENVEEMINNTLSGYFTSCKAIAKHYNVDSASIRLIIKQKIWKHVTKDYDMDNVKSLLDNRNIIFTDDQIREIRLRLKNGESRRSLANFYGVSYGVICAIATGKTYQNVV